MKVKTNKSFKFRRYSKVYKTEYTPPYHFLEEEEPNVHNAKINLASLEIDSSFVGFSSPSNHQIDNSISSWNHVHSPQPPPKIYRANLHPLTSHQASPHTKQRFYQSPTNLNDSARREEPKVHRAKIFGAVNGYNSKKMKRVNQKDERITKQSSKSLEHSMSKAQEAKATRIRCLREIEVVFNHQKEDYQNKQSFRNLILGPQKNYKVQKKDNLDRFHGIHRPNSNKYDLIFKVHKYKKSPLFHSSLHNSIGISLDIKSLTASDFADF